MNALAEEHGCLVLYPEQSCGAHWNRCWNWYDGEHHLRGAGEPALIAGLTRRIMAEHAVDPARVAVAGLSAGGAMAVILGRTYPDLFSAVGCHSGLAHGSASSDAGALLAMRTGAGSSAPAPASEHAGVPVIVFHGDADTTVHRTNGGGVIRQCLDSHAVQGSVADAGVAWWRKQDAAAGARSPAMCIANPRAAYWPSNGPCTGPATPGLAATCVAATPTRADRTPARRCCDSSSAAWMAERRKAGIRMTCRPVRVLRSQAAPAPIMMRCDDTGGTRGTNT